MFGKVIETPQKETTPFIQEVLMVLQNYLLTGQLLIIENHIIYLLHLEFYLIMSPPLEEKNSLLERFLIMLLNIILVQEIY